MSELLQELTRLDDFVDMCEEPPVSENKAPAQPEQQDSAPATSDSVHAPEVDNSQPVETQPEKDPFADLLEEEERTAKTRKSDTFQPQKSAAPQAPVPPAEDLTIKDDDDFETIADKKAKSVILQTEEKLRREYEARLSSELSSLRQFEAERAEQQQQAQIGIAKEYMTAQGLDPEVFSQSLVRYIGAQDAERIKSLRSLYRGAEFTKVMVNEMLLRAGKTVVPVSQQRTAEQKGYDRAREEARQNIMGSRQPAKPQASSNEDDEVGSQKYIDHIIDIQRRRYA